MKLLNFVKCDKIRVQCKLKVKSKQIDTRSQTGFLLVSFYERQSVLRFCVKHSQKPKAEGFRSTKTVYLYGQ